MKPRTIVWTILLVMTMVMSPAFSHAQTSFGKSTGDFRVMLENLEQSMMKRQRLQTLNGRVRHINVGWLRDDVHVLKAAKYFTDDISSLVEFYLENQTDEGIYYDYFKPRNSHLSYRMSVFDHRYWKIFLEEEIIMQRLPVEADVEYLAVEGVHYIWQATADTAFLRQWIPNLEKGLIYLMTDPLRWSKKHQLVKRGYTLDTWDFMTIPYPKEEYEAKGGDIQRAYFNIDENTPMGVMHGDNSGLYAACVQLARFHRELGNNTKEEEWNTMAKLIKIRTNNICWNGNYYSHFVEDDPAPYFLTMDQANTLSLSNTYNINRGLPNEEMAQSIIQTYKDLKESTKEESFAEWFALFPAVEPYFGSYEAGDYVNGGIISIVAGELAKAAFQHGYEAYGADILKRVNELMKKHEGTLPACLSQKGEIQRGIPPNWGQAAVYSAMIEGLAGVIDKGSLFNHVELSPRWMAANMDKADVSVTYGPSKKTVNYTYAHDPKKRKMKVEVSGDASLYDIRLMMPPQVTGDQVKTNIDYPTAWETIRKTNYLVIKNVEVSKRIIEISY